MRDHMASSPEKLLYEQGNIASSNWDGLDIAANDVPVGDGDDVRHAIAAVDHCTRQCTSFLLRHATAVRLDLKVHRSSSKL